MTPDVAAAIAILERLRALARNRKQRGRPLLAPLRPAGASLIWWMQSEPVRIASAKLAWHGYRAAANRSEWLLSIRAAIEDLGGRAP